MDIFACDGMALGANCHEHMDPRIMQFSEKTMARPSFKHSRGFSLVEMLVVIAVVSILMTAAAVGINGLGGKGVTSAVATTEAIFDEARATAKARSIRSCVLVARALTNNPSDDLRRVIVAYEEVDPATGEPTSGPEVSPEDITWELSSRGTVLPEGVYFSETFSHLDHQGATGDVRTVILANAKTNYQGEYFMYPFNSEGVCMDPGTSFVIGKGSRINTQPATQSPPKIIGSARRDFGGFVIWRNGGTSVFRNTEQISNSFPLPGQPF